MSYLDWLFWWEIPLTKVGVSRGYGEKNKVNLVHSVRKRRCSEKAKSWTKYGV